MTRSAKKRVVLCAVFNLTLFLGFGGDRLLITAHAADRGSGEGDKGVKPTDPQPQPPKPPPKDDPPNPPPVKDKR